MTSIYFFLAVAAVFTYALELHISFLMYGLGALIFFYYVPILYSQSRAKPGNQLHEKEFMNLKYYPMELFTWLVACAFFAFMLAHLLADVFFYLPHFTHLLLVLIVFYLVMIVKREQHAKTMHQFEQKSHYTRQGRLLSLEIMFIFLFGFTLLH